MFASKLNAAVVAVALAVLVELSPASAEIRVTTYNTKRRPASTDPVHGDTLNWIGALTAICESESDAGVVRAPDIMALQEIPYTTNAFQELGEAPFDSPANIASMLNDINGVSTYTQMTGYYGDGWITQGYVWNTATVELLGTQMVSIGTRPAVRLKFRPAGYTDPDTEFYVYNVHLKAFPDSEPRRYGEAQSLRRDSDNNLGEGVNVIYAGDFNFTEGVDGERAYTEMLSEGPGQAVDPEYGAEGYFEATYPSTGGGGSRLDFQFLTEELIDGEGLDLIEDSYMVVGPTYIEQLNRYDVVPSDLKFATDHLPVSADYQVPAWMEADAAAETLAPVIVGANAVLDVSVQNIAPATVVAGADELDYTISGTGVVTGSAGSTDLALGGGNSHQIALDASTAGQRSGQVNVTSSSPAVQDGSYSEEVILDVLDHSEASFASSSNQDLLELDLGNHAPSSGTQSAAFDIYNLLATSGYTADLDVESISAAGDTDFLSTNIAQTGIAAGSSESYQALLATSLGQGLFEATYTISVSDEDLLGATSGDQLTLELTGYVAIDGDLTLDRMVSAADLTRLLTNYGQSGGLQWSDGDSTGDSAVTAEDLNRLLTNYGANLATGSQVTAGGAEAPEPASLTILLAFGMTGYACRCRRRPYAAKRTCRPQ